MKLLLIDDEIVALNALRKRVDWMKYGFQETYVAHAAEEAREFLKKTKVDLVLCDVEMPGENGLDLTHFIRTEYPETDVIIVTCHAEFDYLQKAMRSKAFDYILKPIDYEELDAMLQKYVEERTNRENTQFAQMVAERASEIRGEDESEDENKRRIAIVKQYIDEHLHEKIYVENLARLVHVNEQYFMRIFKKETDRSVMEYISERRISVAGTLLKTTNKSINFIADSVGCENYSYFTKLFKKYTGLTPREYRSQFQK